MTKPDKQAQEMQERLELFLNELGSDVEVYRLLVQALFVMVLDGHPNRDHMFQQVRDGVLKAISQNQPPLHDPEGTGKRQQLTLIRTEAEFQEMAKGLGITKTDSSN